MVRLLKLFPNLATEASTSTTPGSSSSKRGSMQVSPTTPVSPVVPAYPRNYRSNSYGNKRMSKQSTSSGSTSTTSSPTLPPAFVRNNRIPAGCNIIHQLKPCYYSPTLERWKHVPSDRPRNVPPEKIRVVTWNVDFMTPFAEERMNCVLDHLRDEVMDDEDDDDDDDESEASTSDGGGKVSSSVVLLQEVSVDALDTLKDNSWVQDNFIMIPRDSSKWPSGVKYGNVTLVSRDVEVERCFIMHFGAGKTQMGRAAVFADVWLGGATGMGGVGPGEDGEYVLRIANVHLESLEVGTSMRPKQMEVVARVLEEDEVLGGLVAGDMNPIDPTVDVTLPRECGLFDAWSGGDDNEEGWTWGYQGQNEGPGGRKYPRARFDKVLYLRRQAYEVDEPRRIGVGLTAQNYAGGAVFASDHFGLKTTIWSM